MKRILAFTFALCSVVSASARPCAHNIGIPAADTTSVANTGEPEGFVEEDVLWIAEQMPLFDGGGAHNFLKWVVSQLAYPEELIAERVEGLVSVSFVVDREGTVCGIKELTSPDPRLTALVVETMKRSPRWEPGRNAGEPVAVRLTLPVKFTLPETPAEDEVPKIVEEMPTFKGGDLRTFSQWVNSRITYPRVAVRQKIEGTVVISFIVEKDGSVGDVRVVRPSHHSLNDEALRVVRSSPKWRPGTQNGKPARVVFQVPINFRIP